MLGNSKRDRTEFLIIIIIIGIEGEGRSRSINKLEK